MAKFNLEKEIEAVKERVPDQNHLLGKGLMQPNRASNSGSRAIMHCTQIEQVLSLLNPEPPILSTGYENRYGEMASNYVTVDTTYTVIDKIPKYEWDTSRHRKYTMILLDSANDTLHCIERTPYQHVSEFYGYYMNTEKMDSLMVGDPIMANTVIKTPASFDEYKNRQDGVNLKTMYIASGLTTEDPTVLSESAAKKFTSPLFEKVKVMINNNDILLNLYGGDTVDSYKGFPDIGETIKDGMLCAIRRQNKNESLHTQSWNNLKKYMISDEKYPISNGTIIDINVRCNDPEALKSSIYNQQLLKYYEGNKTYCKKIVDIVKPLISKGMKMSYQMSSLYTYCQRVCNDVQYIDDKIFNNIIMEIDIVRYMPLIEGDKITDRYGGKGVISKILPDEEMPQVQNINGEWEPVDILYNKCTCVNRLNPGQLFETSLTAYGEGLIEYMFNYKLQPDDCANLIYKYLNIVSPGEAEFFWSEYTNLIDEDKFLFIRSYMDDGAIYVVSKPITGTINLDTLRALKEEFPFINIQKPAMINMKDSSGNIRKVLTNNTHITIGKKYIFRLKQVAEEKFSAVSLASTNIRGENTKSKASKQHKTLFSSTPVRFGEMEFGDFMHMLDVILLDSQLMRSSTSPVGRMQHKDLLTGNPFVMDVKLNKEAKSRPVEIVNAYLKTIGLKIEIKKHPKKKKAVKKFVITRDLTLTNKRIFEREPFEITQEQAHDIVKTFRKVLGKPMDIIYRTDEESKLLREEFEKYEATRIANIGVEQKNVKSAEELLKAINNNEISERKKVIFWKSIVKRTE